MPRADTRVFFSRIGRHSRIGFCVLHATHISETGARWRGTCTMSLTSLSLHRNSDAATRDAGGQRKATNFIRLTQGVRRGGGIGLSWQAACCAMRAITSFGAMARWREVGYAASLFLRLIVYAATKDASCRARAASFTGSSLGPRQEGG